MAYDSLHHAIVLFGGHVAAPGSRGSGGPSDETWIWNGSNWTQALPTTSPRGWAARAVDVSAHGLSLTLGRRFERGTILSVNMDSADGDTARTLFLRVVRTTVQENGRVSSGMIALPRRLSTSGVEC